LRVSTAQLDVRHLGAARASCSASWQVLPLQFGHDVAGDYNFVSLTRKTRGAPGGIRTPDPRIRSLELVGSPLPATARYCPIFQGFRSAHFRRYSPLFVRVGVRVGVKTLSSHCPLARTYSLETDFRMPDDETLSGVDGCRLPGTVGAAGRP
jgi:hypothetical protein